MAIFISSLLPCKARHKGSFNSEKEYAVLHSQRFFAALFKTALAALFFSPTPTYAAGSASSCNALIYEGKAYTVCQIDLKRHAVRLFWKDPAGQPYGYLGSLPRTDEAKNPLLFASNAGMFKPDYSPAGLYVENGRQLFAANTHSGGGNFHKKPNGVFYVTREGAGVAETGAYLKRKIKADFATQSGPMLVVNGHLHPAFRNDSTSFKRRDGIGVRNETTVFFAISDQDVPFIEFARLFRDKLKCPNALFLDGGSVPTVYFSDAKRGNNILPMGPMLGVFQRPISAQ
jgi:uncharacterized protein YigE (DUF2233 family)